MDNNIENEYIPATIFTPLNESFINIKFSSKKSKFLDNFISKKWIKKYFS